MQWKNLWCLLFAVLIPAGPAVGLEQFDSSAMLPALVQAAKSARASLKAYRRADKQAEAAAKQLANGLRGVPAAKLDETKAQLYVNLEGDMDIQVDQLGQFYSQMETIKAGVESGTVGNVAEISKHMDAMATEFQAAMEQRTQSAEALKRVSDVDADAVSEEQAREMVTIYKEVKQRQAISDGLDKKRKRINDMAATINSRLQNIKDMMSAVDARLSELKAEKEMVRMLQGWHQTEMICQAAGACDVNGNLNIEGTFTSKTSGLLDSIITPSASAGGTVSWKKELQNIQAGHKSAVVAGWGGN